MTTPIAQFVAAHLLQCFNEGITDGFTPFVTHTPELETHHIGSRHLRHHRVGDVAAREKAIRALLSLAPGHKMWSGEKLAIAKGL